MIGSFQRRSPSEKQITCWLFFKTQALGKHRLENSFVLILRQGIISKSWKQEAIPASRRLPDECRFQVIFKFVTSSNRPSFSSQVKLKRPIFIGVKWIFNLMWHLLAIFRQADSFSVVQVLFTRSKLEEHVVVIRWPVGQFVFWYPNTSARYFRSCGFNFCRQQLGMGKVNS